MYLNRSIIKHQAKELIKGNVFKLFAISLVVSLCVYLISGVISGIAAFNTFSYFNEIYKGISDADSVEDFLEDYFRDYYGDYFGDYFDDYFDKYFDEYSNGYSDGFDDSGYFDGFGDEGWDFHNFGGELSLIPAKSEAVAGAYKGFSVSFSYVPSIITVVLAPLAVTLAGLYVSFIRGKRFGFEEGVKSVFTDAFKVNYLKKLGVNFLRSLVAGLLSMLLFIPGIIFSYSSYFAFQIICDYPELSAWDAIKLSKKIVKGNRFELFLMNLSFIPWAFLCVFIFPIIYLIPYMEATNALYYENFRLRAIQEGRVTEDDFLSDAQRCAKYGAMGNNQYYSPNSAQQGTYYHTAQQPPYGAPNYSAPYQQYNQAANPRYGAAPNQPFSANVNQQYQPYGAPVNQQYNSTPSTPPADPQEAPRETTYEAPKPAEPTDYPWEGK